MRKHQSKSKEQENDGKAGWMRKNIKNQTEIWSTKCSEELGCKNQPIYINTRTSKKCQRKICIGRKLHMCQEKPLRLPLKEDPLIEINEKRIKPSSLKWISKHKQAFSRFMDHTCMP